MEQISRRVEEARQRWNAGDLPGYLALYDPTIRLYGYGPEPFDKPAAKSFYEMSWSSLGVQGKPNPQLEFHETLCDGDLYACCFTMTGVHRGAFLGVAATGRPYALSGITIMRFNRDRNTVVQRSSSADMLGLLVQVGALPPPQ